MMMNENEDLSLLAQALADPLRLILLQHLMSGPATIAELQSLLRESQSNVSNHLATLCERDLVQITREGRQESYELRDASVAHLIKVFTLLARRGPTKRRKSLHLIGARTCYDHLAGRYGVALFDGLLIQGVIKEPTEVRGDVEVGLRGTELLEQFGLNLHALRREHRRFACACPDWTERRPHLGGALGAALWTTFMERGWAIKQQGTRAISITDVGKQHLYEQFGIQVDKETV
jgi:DNA-binding transcriptional ArsR family regulator